MSYYIHSVPGRLRVKSPVIKGDAEKARDLKDRIETMQGVNSAAANPVTGSIVVTYDTGHATQEDILGILSGMGHFEPSKAVTHDEYIRDKASKAGKLIGRAVMGTFIEKAFEGSALSLLALIV
jgi:copper chaperone CopZ